MAALCSLAVHCAGAETRALLVGVSVYPHLTGKQLDGPVNDLRLMRSVVALLGVHSDNVTELSEAAGPSRQPTRAHIVAHLERLAQLSAPGDWVLLYFSGHGAQVPQTPATRRAHPEPDGMDEVFLPRDTARWVPGRGVVEGAIVDDEFARLFGHIHARGAQVWAIFDTCHAGDVTRAGGPADDGRPVWRRVAAQDLGIAPRALHPRQARGRAGMTENGEASRRPLTSLRVPAPQTVAFFASQADEPAAEELFIDPLEGKTRLRFGVFTYHLHEALMRGDSGNFASLAKAVELAYRARPFPTPQFTGDLGLRWPGWQVREGPSVAR
jgi:hypothetical protein